MKRRLLIIILLALSVGFISVDAKASMTSVTIATFADPSRSSRDPLFTVDFRPAQLKLTGGWAEGKKGLTLEIPSSGYTFTDAWFEMGTVGMTIVSPLVGQTGPGVINFYANGPKTTIPLLCINFASGLVSRYGFGADGRFDADNVTITGSQIRGTLSEEQFSFSFANTKRLTNNPNDGFTTTAAFTSSATVNTEIIPEPATICLLGMGVLSIVSRKKVHK